MPAAGSAAEACLRRADWQRVLFAERPRRNGLLGLVPCWPCRDFRLRVHRNQPFEFVASAMAPFLAYAGLAASPIYGDYDDSLSLRLHGEAAVELVWLDFERYRDRLDAAELAEWLAGRLATLRSQSDAPILVANWSADDAPAAAFNARIAALVGDLAGVRLCDQAAIAADLGADYRDRRLAAVGGTQLSDAACILTAREMGLSWLPAALLPRLKAVAVDLDHTLYDGVLGEDGVQALRMGAGHAALQRRLVALREDGLLLAVVSRNEPADVDRLFAARDDFPLRAGHISAMAIGWQAKADALRGIAERLRIGADAILFVDDNPGELAAAAAALPGLHTLHADADVATAVQALDCYPGLFRWAAGGGDHLRAGDLAAAPERARMRAEADDLDDYFRALAVRLSFAVDPQERLARLHELSRKTNQFNLALRRLGEAEIARRLADPDWRVVSVALSDRLADSGVVAALFARRAPDAVVVDELCISCRALGRGLEDVMIATAVDRVVNEFGGGRVRFSYAKGPRNRPARDWLSRFGGRKLEAPGGGVTIEWPPPDLPARPIAIAWEDSDAA